MALLLSLKPKKKPIESVCDLAWTTPIDFKYQAIDREMKMNCVIPGANRAWVSNIENKTEEDKPIESLNKEESCGKCSSSLGPFSYLCPDCACGWITHEYTKPKTKGLTFEEAITAFKDEKKIKRPCFVKPLSVYKYERGDNLKFILAIEDVFSDDWEIVE